MGSPKISKTVNLYVFIATYHPPLSVFMTNKTPGGVEERQESIEPENSKMAKMFSSSSEGLAQHCVNSRWFAHETAAFYTEQCTSTTSSLLHDIEVSKGAHSHSLKNYGFDFGAPFSSFRHAHAHFLIA